MKKLIAVCAVILLFSTAYTMAGSPNANVRLGMFGSYDNNPLRSCGRPFDISNPLPNGLSLTVTLTSSCPMNDILLINNTGSNSLLCFSDIPVNYGYPSTPLFYGSVQGTFDNVAGNYTFVIPYSENGQSSNDIVLIVPEPATLLLLGLGGLVLRRKI